MSRPGRRSEFSTSTLRVEALESRRLLAADIRISEFMASNSSTIEDSFAESSDWVELFNAGDTDIDLAGYYLTDDALDLEKWAIPSVILPAGGEVLIFASGRNLVTLAGELHANFQIAADGEYLAIVHPDGSTIVDQFTPTFPAQRQDVSYGLAMEVLSSLVFCELRN